MINSIWHRLFLDKRPSIGLAFFRMAVAMTVGLHVIPSFFHLDDNYLSTAFKTQNHVFFPQAILDMVAKSPDAMVLAWVGLFVVSWFCFLIGLFSQISAILLMLSCYYFYALNDFYIGTLSWDILLVTMSLMCVTNYHGDYFSVDALRRSDADAYRRRRPMFIQRLLQLQLASTFFYTALYKVTAEGNWVTGNPIHVLMNYPPMGVTKHFLIKEYLAAAPGLCYGIGLFIVAMELSLPFLLFYPKTRRSAIILGFIFHVVLVLTLDVPAIFLFLFPAQMLLFINPDHIIDWVDAWRRRPPDLTVIYDGQCGFCRASVARLRVMDLFGRLSYRPTEEAISEVKLIDGDKVLGGFDAFRRMCFYLPMLYPMLLFVYLPGSTWIGRAAYRFIARRRYWLHQREACRIR